MTTTNDPSSISTCHLHPDHPVTGFCAACLRDRLSLLHPNPSASLRRCKSFSVGRDPLPHDPHRRSCHALVDHHPALRPTNHHVDLHDRPLRPTDRHVGLHDQPLRPTSHHVDIDDRPLRPTNRHVDIDDRPLRPTNHHVDLDDQPRRSGFRLAASVVSKKLRTWRGPQKLKKQAKPPPELAVDTDPRFSFDDQPRASWDGYIFGRFPRNAAVERSDGLIPVEDDRGVPGGARRRSLDRSGSVRRSAPVAELGEFRCNSNARVSDHNCSDSFDYGHTQKDRSQGRWSRAWSLWGLIQRRGSDAVETTRDERAPRVNGVADGRRSFSGIGGMGRKRREEFGLERNLSARYSVGRSDDGMLKFYEECLLPSNRRGGMRIEGSTASIANSVLRLY